MRRPVTVRTTGAVFHGPRRSPVLEQLELDAPGPGEVLVRMLASGVCHSDLHVVDGDWERPIDVVMGHEGAAVVEALGPDVGIRPDGDALDAPGLRPGALVVLAWTAPCGVCWACRRGEAWLCSDPLGAGHRRAPGLVRMRRTDGSPVGVYSGIGTWSERQVVVAQAAVPVDPRTPPAIAALIGCAVTTGVGAVLDTARVRPGESVVVIGAGAVGLSVVMAAALTGADPIVALDTVPAKLDLARQAGATHTLLVGPTVLTAATVSDVRERTAGGADHVFEAVGRVASVELAVELARRGGAVTLVGMTPQGDRAGVDVYRFVEDGKRLLGCNYGSAVPAVAFPRIARLYAAGRLPLDLLVSERITLGGIDAALAAMRAGSGVRRVITFG